MDDMKSRAELLLKISTLEQTIERQDIRLSDRRQILIAKRFLTDDLTHQIRRVNSLHEAVKAKYDAQENTLRDLRDDKEAQDAIIRGMEQSLKDARDNEAKLQQALDKSRSNLKAYQTGAIAALTLFPSLKKVAAFQKLAELSQQETRERLPESTKDHSILEEKCAQGKAISNKPETSHPVVAEDSPSPTRKRKAKHLDATRSGPSTDATPQAKRSAPEATGLLSPPPSARRKQPKRAAKSEYSGIDGFYKIFNTGSHLKWE